MRDLPGADRPPVPVKRSAIVTFAVEGFHRWPNAPEHRAYLRASHRHLFCVRVELEVHHDEREVEFHDLLDYCRAHFAEGNQGAASCETMAYRLAQALALDFPGRDITVIVSEDGENGAAVEYKKDGLV